MRVLVLDTETSGLHPHEGAGVVEIAGVLLDFRDGGVMVVIDDWQSLVNPGHKIPAEASAVHHLIDRDVEDAPDLPEACDVMREDLVSWDYVFAHNAKFDHKFVPIFHDKPWGCTLKGARALVESPSYSNQVLRYHLNLQPVIPDHCGGMPHRALYDCYCTAYLLNYLLQLSTLEKIVDLSNKPQLQKKCNFGKNKGKLWKDVDRSYKYWVLNQTGERAFDEDVVHTCKYWLSQG